MNKHTSAFILSLTVILALFVYGCCSHSKNAFFISPAGDAVVTSREVIIDELGRLPTVTFPSGAKIEGLEENTLTPGIVVILTEQSISSQNSGYFSEGTNSYFYKITAFQNHSNPASSKTYVTTTEKPIKITLPKPQDSKGIVFAGIKESDTDPWRLFNFSDSNEILANIAGIRAVEANVIDNTFNLFRFGTQFALISYEGNKGNKLPETYVTGLNATSTASIMVKDGKYTENLTIKSIIKGIKLDSIKPTDLRARITYRNNHADEAPIKVNNVNVTQTNKADKTVPGYTYAHSFQVDFISEPNLMGTDGNFSFTLNLNDIETQLFSSGFLIEFFNKVDSERVLPFIYTEFYSIKQVGVYDIVYDLDGGSLATANPTTYSEASESFSLNEPTKEGYTFIGWTGSNGDEPQTTVTIEQGSMGNRNYTANWSAVAYNITYELNGGTLAESNPSGYNIASETFTLNEPTKEGYTFTGWTGSNGDVPQKPISIVQGSKSNLNFNANYSLINYEITYFLNGGTENTSPTYYDVTSATINLSQPTKDGYSFAGWSGTEIDGIASNVAILQGSIGNREYTANWSINSYRLDLVKGVGIDTISGDGLHEYNSEVTATCTVLAGYEFDSWSGDFTFGNITMPAANATMTANTKLINYNITYELDEGVADNETSYNVESADITLNAPAKQGFDFIGWTGSNGDTPTIDVVIPQGSTGNKSYTANYTQRYSITYVLGGGTETTNPTSYNVFTEDILLNNPTLTGYEFTGWSGDDLLGDENMAVTIPQGSTGNRTYTAHYNPVSYSISYNLHGGQLDVGLTNPANYDITSASILLYKPTRPNHDFIGWEGTDIDGVASDVTILTGSINNRSYVASWSAKAVLTYNLSNSVTIELKRCPAGIFMMGSSENELGHDDNEDQHQVTLTRDFYMGTYEVTQEQYVAVMGNNPSASVGDKKPVEKVNWDNAKAFCDLMNSNIASSSLPDGYYFSLPSDAQWEYACRAGTTESLNSGNNIAPVAGICSYLNELGWYSGNSGGETHVVGQKSPNNWGLYDMHGNVLEWTRDRYRDYYTTVPEIDPEGNSSGDSIVNRGGYYSATPEKCRSAYRSLNKYYAEFSIIGFRLAVVKNPE